MYSDSTTPSRSAPQSLPSGSANIPVAVFYAAAEYHRSQGEFADAERALREADLRAPSVHSAAALGRHFLECGDLGPALRAFHRMREAAARDDDLPAIAEACLNLAATYRELGDLPRSSEFFLLAQRLSLRSGTLCQGETSLSAGRWLSDAAAIALLAHNLPHAIDLLERAIQCERSQRAAEAEAGYTTNLGVAHWRAGDVEQAYSLWRTALRAHRRLGDWVGIARDLVYLSLYLLHRNRREAARLALEQLAQVSRKLRRPDWQAIADRGLRVLHTRRRVLQFDPSRN